MAPVVSVVIPVRDRAAFVEQTVRSVQRQSLAAFEVWLCDDDSDLETVEVMARAARADPRFGVLARGRRPPGASARRNDGAAAATGRYLVFLDSDDVLEPDCLRDRVAWMDRRPELAYAVSDCRVFVDRPGDTPYAFNAATAEDDLERFVRHDFPWQTTGPTWRRERFAALGGWDESLPSWQDWDLHLRAVSTPGLTYARTGMTDFQYRAGGGIAIDALTRIEHLHTRRPLLAKIAARLVAQHRLDTRAAVLLVGLYFDVAWRLACEGHGDGALALWEDAVRLGLVGTRRAWEGRAMLRAAARPRLRPWALRYRFSVWPVDLHHTPSPTLTRRWAWPDAVAPRDDAITSPGSPAPGTGTRG